MQLKIKQTIRNIKTKVVREPIFIEDLYDPNI